MFEQLQYALLDIRAASRVVGQKRIFLAAPFSSLTDAVRDIFPQALRVSQNAVVFGMNLFVAEAIEKAQAAFPDSVTSVDVELPVGDKTSLFGPSVITPGLVHGKVRGLTALGEGGQFDFREILLPKRAFLRIGREELALVAHFSTWAECDNSHVATSDITGLASATREALAMSPGRTKEVHRKLFGGRLKMLFR